MKDLKVLEGSEFDQLEKIVKFTPDEQAYWNDMESRRNAIVEKKDFQGKLKFYLQELNSIKDKFGERVAVERRLKFYIGHAHEWLATKALKNPKEIAEMFERAVLWYQAADEMTGFLSDYAFRQCEASWGAAHFRKEMGLDDELTKWYEQRGRELLEATLGKNRTVVLINTDILGEMSDKLKQRASEIIDSAAKMYLFEDKSKTIYVGP